jgi:2-oxoglutarate ferredoxin oxidoreductase subunit delta
MARGSVTLNIENCKGCELCVENCPQDSLALSPQINAQGFHYAVLVKDNCTGCTNCALVCPDAVITVYRESKKKKVPVATISNVTGNLTVTITDERA